MKDNIKIRQKLVNNPVMLQVVADIARCLNEEVLGASVATDIEYEMLAREVLRKVKEKYRDSMKLQDIIPRQIDLCDAIEEIYRTNKEKEDRVLKKLTE